MPKEIWKKIVGYEGQYEVSNLGNVRSLNYGGTGEIRNLKLTKDKKGYLKVHLGKHKIFRVHRLVATAFIPNPDGLPCVNHRNEIKDDNRVENLEWISWQDNLNYGTRNERAAKSISKLIIQLDKDGNYVNNWRSQTVASDVLGITSQGISQCCHGKVRHCNGYKWVLEKDYHGMFKINLWDLDA